MFLRGTHLRPVDRLIIIVAGVWIAMAIGFAVFYYMDRYGQTSSPIVDQEIEHITKSIQQRPMDADARVEISLYMLERNMINEAIDQSGQVLRAKPDHQGALFVLAKAYLAKKDEDSAIGCLQRILELNKTNQYASLNPNLGMIHYDLGTIYLNRKVFDQAANEFRGALAIDQADADAYFGLGQALEGQGEHGQAIDAYLAALRLDPEYPTFYKGLKTVFEKEGMSDQASFADAMILYGQGNYTGASDKLVMVTQALPEFQQAYRGLGMSYEKSGENDRAIEAYKKAIELDPTDRASMQRLDRLKNDGVG